jgi:hypothetical protein
MGIKLGAKQRHSYTCVLTKTEATKTHGGVEEQLHSFLISVLDEEEFVRFIFQKFSS